MSDERACEIDIAAAVADLQSPDAKTRVRAIHRLCPCRSGFDGFERHLALLEASKKDADPRVQAAALHVFEDAAEILSEGLPTRPAEYRNEMLRTRRASRFRSDEPDRVRPRRRAGRR